MKTINFTKKPNKKAPIIENKPYKKKALGQHFLRKHSTVDTMINSVTLCNKHTILEIGCGDGFLTRALLETKAASVICYELDEEWASYVKKLYTDSRLTIINKSILDVKEADLHQYRPIVVLANLPYQITFPILFLFQSVRHLIEEGVIMVQEEVAQKLVATSGKKYSKTSLYLQYFFDFKLLEKIEPQAFSPAPKVFSRLVYFKPKSVLPIINKEDDFWKFVSLCFMFPRRTLINNLKSTHYNYQGFSPDILAKRAQELSFQEFIMLWETILLHS